MSRSQATGKGDIGIENASPGDIREALSKAHCTDYTGAEIFKEEDLFKAGLAGRAESKGRRQELGRLLGIGGGNAKTFLNKLNGFNITREEFDETLRTIYHK